MNSVDERRVRRLNSREVTAGPVVYVMGRDQRVADNWALLYAQQRARELQVPLLVLFAVGPMFLSGSARHNQWLVGSLRAVELGLSKKNIPFFVEVGDWVAVVATFCRSHKVGAVVFDHNPLEPIRSWRDTAAKALSVAVYEVDAHNIVPVWYASDKEEFAAYTFRPKIHRKLPEFLTDFPKLKKQTDTYTTIPIDWNSIEQFRVFDRSEPVPTSFKPGELAAQKVLESFISERLKGYAEGRNDPNRDHVSHLSPYLRWGNLSAQRVALTVKEAKGFPGADKEAFLEELIVRRELSDNFVFYNKKYNKVAGAHAWAQETIKKHAKDKREYLYTYRELAAGKTHDPLWNAAQLQMVKEGKMHGYLRMYWAKKILEWTKDAQTAIDYALKLNDTYELDGRDPNGVVGVMWSICGVHDRAWPERPIFGKIRYMNFNGAKRKFDVDAFCDRYLGTETLFTNGS